MRVPQATDVSASKHVAGYPCDTFTCVFTWTSAVACSFLTLARAHHPIVIGARMREALGHQLVYVVDLTVLDAGADAPGPRGPEAGADPALPEGGHPRGRPVGGIA